MDPANRIDVYIFNTNTGRKHLLSKLTCSKERVKIFALIGTLPVHTMYMIRSFGQHACDSIRSTVCKCERSYFGLRGNHWKAMESFCENAMQTVNK